VKVSIEWTGVITNDLIRFFTLLRAEGEAYYQERVWSPPVYFPPGVYWRMRPDAGRQAYRLPPPHHPLELYAAARGMERYTVMETVRSLRAGNWLDYTARVARQCLWTPSQARLVYHLLTPLHTNGGAPGDWEYRAHKARADLYRATGIRGPGSAATDAAIEAVSRDFDRPVRLNFWGVEVYGRVEL
jgi:hypothetical protein